MSLDPMLWALKDAPVANVEERAVLALMAEAAHEDGCNSFLSQATLAKRSLLSDRTVRDRLAEMESRRLIARGDQAAAVHIPADRRPVVYDLLIPFSWFSRIQRINEYRANQGRAPLTPDLRPDIADAPPRKRRADLGVPKRVLKGDDSDANRDDSDTAGVQLRPDESDVTAGVQLRPDLKSATAGVQLRDGRSTTPTTQLVNSVINPSPQTPRDATAGETDLDAATKGEEAPRFDEQTMLLLAAAVEETRRVRPGWSEPAIRKAMVAALDAGRDPESVAWAIVKAAGDKTTDLPTRITSDAWWRVVKSERHVTAPGAVPADRRCQRPGHLAEVANRCSICRNDERIAEREAARLAKAAADAEAAANAPEPATSEADGVSAEEVARRVARNARFRPGKRALV